MNTLHRATNRFHTQIGWLDSWHSFSFGEHYDPNRQGFRGLRVINDDRVAAGMGFGMHGHRDMEIITIVLEGALRHQDSLGNGDILRPGEVQVMSAGSGIRHSEFNPLDDATSHFLQIWIEPDQRGDTPRYAQRAFAAAPAGAWAQVAGPDDSEGSLRIGANARVRLSHLVPGVPVQLSVPEGRHAWLHLATGSATIGDLALQAGDAISTSTAGELQITPSSAGLAVAFDLA